LYDGSPSAVALINLVRDSVISGKYPGNDSSQNPRNIPFPFRFAILVILGKCLSLLLLKVVGFRED